MRRILPTAAILLVIAALVVILGVFSGGSGDPTYKLEFDNAFGLVTGAPFKVAGVPAGSISAINLCYTDRAAHCSNPLDALVTVQVSAKGFGSFRSDASCQSRPQSLIGEYFVDCSPGQYGKPLRSGGTLTASHTFSTIPADLLMDIMQMPERERLTVVIDELGAAVAGRSTDLQTALQRAVPAIDETDNLLELLANDSQTLKALTANSNTVVTALANNSKLVQNFIVEADKAATDTATQDANLKTSLQRFPALLEQLRPAMGKLGTAATANTPVLNNLNAASGQIRTLFTNLASCSSPHTGHQCGFANAALPALQSLGQASVTGKQAVQAATPTVSLLNQFSKPTPELAQNLAIVLDSLDTQSDAVEPDPRSPGGKGFSGLEALLQYVFNQSMTINTYSTYGHMLAVDAFANPMCSPYATPATVASSLKTYGAAYRQCYSWYGPNQPGVNETDPSDPSACVPDPGGAPPGEPGPKTTAAACPASLLSATPPSTSAKANVKKKTASSSGANSGSSSGSPPSGSSTPTTPAAPGVTTPAPGVTTPAPEANLPGVLGTVKSAVGAATGAITSTTPTATTPTVTPPQLNSNAASGAPTAQQAQQLLNYLLSP